MESAEPKAAVEESKTEETKTEEKGGWEPEVKA